MSTPSSVPARSEFFGMPAPLVERGSASAEPWWNTTDPRRLAVLHALVVTFAILVGAYLALGLQMLPLTDARGSGLEEGAHRRLFSMHGLWMVFLVALPAIPTVLGNLLLPHLCGRRDMTWPRLNLLSFQLFLAGVAVLGSALCFAPADAGWSFDPPFSLSASSAGPVWTLIGVLLLLSASVCSSASFLATVVASRFDAGAKTPLWPFAWSMALSSGVQLVASPVLAILVMLFLAERGGAVDLFGSQVPGGDLRWAGWFGWWSRSMLAAVLLPALGIVGQLVLASTGHRGATPRSTVSALLAIGVFGLAGGGVSGLGPAADAGDEVVASALGVLGVLPFVPLLVDWLSRLGTARYRLSAEFTFVLGFVALLATGALAQLFVSVLPTGAYLRHTTFANAQIHFWFAGAVWMALLAGLYHAWPHWFGTSPRENRGRLAAVTLTFGALLAFLPGLVLGALGQPARSRLDVVGASGWNTLAAVGGVVLLTGLALAVHDLFRAYFASDAPERARAS